jgi:hypothetical protein
MKDVIDKLKQRILFNLKNLLFKILGYVKLVLKHFNTSTFETDCIVATYMMINKINSITF